jgi:hypothetical protein
MRARFGDTHPPLNARDVGVMMSDLKFSRMLTGKQNPDDGVDAVGYAACTAELDATTPRVAERVGGFWYLATPYSKYPGGIEAAFKLACINAGVLMKAGIAVFSPIAHTHPIVIACKMDPFDDFFFWVPPDKPMMEAARGVILLQAEGWQQSVGMQIEREAFTAACKPVILMQPGILPPDLDMVEF